MGRSIKQRPDITDAQVAEFLKRYPDGANSRVIAEFLGEPTKAFVAEAYRLEKKLAFMGARYV